MCRRLPRHFPLYCNSSSSGRSRNSSNINGNSSSNSNNNRRKSNHLLHLPSLGPSSSFCKS